MKRILIVGAGLSGAVLARELANTGRFMIHLIDKRDHVAGNAYDFKNHLGIIEHKYGPHLFHTKNEKVFKYLSEFTDWVEYRHKVKALLKDGTYVTLPVNLDTVEKVGEENIVDTFYRPYSEKMWGIPLEEISKDILNRVPVRNDRNEFYFPDDKFQFLPKDGYTEMVKNILNHKNIKLELNKEFESKMINENFHSFLSLPIDEFYEFRYGKLPYRSIKFKTVNLPLPKVLPETTVNFTNREPFTRVTEWNHLPNNFEYNRNYTTICYEEPCSYEENNNQRFYPVKDAKGEFNKLYLKYKKLAEKDETITFIGRLGLYKYLDMDQCINSALILSKNFKKLHN